MCNKYNLMPNSKKHIQQLIIAVVGVYIAAYLIVLFNNYLLMEFPMIVRMILLIITQWTLLIVPFILIKKNQEQISDYIEIKKNIPKQIIIGIILGLIMSFFFTLIPILLGFKEIVGSTTYNQAWKFIYEFVYGVIGVALAEEIVFRGYVFNKLLQIKKSRFFAIILSSIIFGIFHIFNGNILQVFMTFIIGVIFCLCREKIKNCTLLSLIIIHGLHNWLIILLVTIL